MFTICIPHEYFRNWHDQKESGALTKKSYTEILNAVISIHGIQINEWRIDEILRKSCGEIKSKCSKLNGRHKVEYLSKKKEIPIFHNEIIKVADLQEQIKHTNGQIESLSDEKKS